MNAKFRITPRSDMGPLRRWMIVPPNVIGCGCEWVAFAPTLSEAFAIVNRHICIPSEKVISS